MSKLTQDDLLGELEAWFGCASHHGQCSANIKEQAYNQIKKIIELWYRFNLWDLRVGEVVD